jgi:asparagine synthase (glutamine-hydrolysing)
MCGIAGVVAGNAEIVLDALPKMLTAQIHRGPDDGGQEVFALGDSALGLGARRLAIIDLSPAGHQPMIHPETGDTLVFSGEIYDFRSLQAELEANGVVFRGRSDTEVLLHALVRWGPACLSRLKGMFALAFFQRQQRRLLLARDPLGIRPLYVAAVPGAFLFANEVRAILASGLVPYALDMQGIGGMVAFGAVQEPNTLFKNIRAFSPGCWQSCPIDGLRDGSTAPAYRHWKYPAVQADVSAAEAVPAVEAALEAAVHDHLVSDVPIGLFLSSGLDSAIVAGLATRYGSEVRAFTVGFPDAPDMSEVTTARETAQLMGADHTTIELPAREALATVSEWLQSLDQPSADGLNTYVIAKAVRDHGIGVALSGLGGDELFGGYSTFVHIPVAKGLQAPIRRLPMSVKRMLALAATSGQSEAVRLKTEDMICNNGDVLDLYLLRRQEMSNRQLLGLGINPAQIQAAARDHLAQTFPDLSVDDRDIVRSIACLESRFYLGNTLLRDSDSNCMAHSLEVRVPMLDRRVIDCVLSLPGRILLPSGKANKHLLRRSFAPLLRPRLIKQKKRGFMLPIARWMTGPLRELCETALTDLKAHATLSGEGVDSVWRSFLASPHSQMWSRAFTLCVLGVHLREMRRHSARDVRPSHSRHVRDDSRTWLAEPQLPTASKGWR